MTTCIAITSSRKIILKELQSANRLKKPSKKVNSMQSGLKTFMTISMMIKNLKAQIALSLIPLMVCRILRVHIRKRRQIKFIDKLMTMEQPKISNSMEDTTRNGMMIISINQTTAIMAMMNTKRAIDPINLTMTSSIGLQRAMPT